MAKPIVIILFGLLCLNLIGCVNKKTSTVKESPESMLLKDWQPESIYKIPITKIEKAKFPVIDMHAHDYATTESGIADRAHVYDSIGVEKSVVFAGVTGAKFDSIYAKYAKYPDHFMVYCGLDFSGYKEKDWAEKAIKELKRDVAEGAQGIGEIHDKGLGLSSGGVTANGMHPDDPRFDPILDAIGKLGIPLIIHITDPKWMYEPMDSTNDGLMRSWTWRIKDVKDNLGYDGLIEAMAHMLGKHPDTKIIICHLGNLTYDLSRLGKLFDTYPNFYADISARFSEFGTIPRYAAEFFTKYQDRLVYGTDYGWETWKPRSPYGQKEPDLAQMYRMTFRVLETADEHFYMTNLLGYKWPLYGLGLSDSVLRKIYNTNAMRIIEK